MGRIAHAVAFIADADSSFLEAKIADDDGEIQMATGYGLDASSRSTPRMGLKTMIILDLRAGELVCAIVWR